MRILILVLLMLALIVGCAPAAPTASPTSEPLDTPTDTATEEAAVPTNEVEATEEAEAADADSTDEAEAEATEEAAGESTEEVAAAPMSREQLEERLDWTCPEEVRGGTLNIYNWASYVAPDTVENFQTLCDATVIYDTYPSNEDMVARLRLGNPGYDLVVPSNYIVSTMIGEELLTPLTLDNIPNFANVTAELANPDYDPGNRYTVPYQWGTVGIAYNTTKISEPFTSWQEFFDYEGPVAWIEDTRAMLSIALVMLGFDPNSENPDEIISARDFLIENSENVVTMVVGNSQQLLGTGEVDAAIDYNGNALQLQAQCACADYSFVIPQEGANIWIDNIAIPADAPNARLAEAFIDYLYAPQVSADLSNYIGYATPNQAALDQELILPEMRANPAVYPSEEVLSRMFFAEANPDTQQLYSDAWDQVKVSISQ